jgi:DNA-binding transcriptional ArsR family regulator
MSVPNRTRTVTQRAPCGAPRITRAEIARAVPAGSALTRSGRKFLAALEADPAVTAMRQHGRRNLLAVAAVYAGHVSRRAGTTWPGHAGVQAATGLREATVKRHVRWLREHGYLGTVRQGSTPATRRGARAGDGNEAAVYCLTVPRPAPCPARPRPQSAPPTSRRRKSLLLENNPGARKRAGTPRPAETRPPAWRDGTLGRIPLPVLLAIARPYTAAGWTPADIAYAVDHHPDGTPHWNTRRVRNPGGWARHRLSHWTAPDGTPARSRSGQLADQAAAHRARAVAQEHLAPVTARAARLRSAGGYASTADPAPQSATPAAPLDEVLAALRARLGPAARAARRDDRLIAAQQAEESRRARGASPRQEVNAAA